MKKFVTLLFAVLLIHTASPLLADWPCRTDTTVPVCVAPGNQWNLQAATDGANGAYFVWQDRRNGPEDKLYIQRLSSNGQPQWTAGGIPLAATNGYQYYPQIISDGSGGVFIAWEDNRSTVNYDIYVQHVSSLGNPLWTMNGVAVCNATGQQYNPQLITDGTGGVYVTWQDNRSGQFDVYAQHLSAAGSQLWQLNGIPVCSAVSDQIEPVITTDGLSGAVIAWIDFRAGTGFSDVYAQRILPSGLGAWQTDGVPICQATNTQWNVRIATDGATNTYIVWQDRRNGTYDNIYAQLIDQNGAPKWVTDGVALAPLISQQYYPEVASDGTGGIAVTWQDNRTGSDYDIYAQRLNKKSQAIWSTTGQPVCVVPGNQYYPQIIAQNGNVIIAWQDRRNGTDYDIYAQRLDMSGNIQWTANGNPVSTETLDQYSPQIVTDNQNGVIAGWSDFHTGISSTDIFAQRLGANGLPAGGCYRTMTQAAFALKGIKTYNRAKKTVTMPNEGNVRDTIFYRGAFADGLYLGYPRPDNTKQYAWELYTASVYVRNALPQYGVARPLNEQLGRPMHNVLRNPTVKRYNNRISGELLTLKINIAMSDVGLSAPHLGEIVFYDTAAAPNVLNNKTLRQIAAFADSTLTYWRLYSNFNYIVLGNWLSNINGAFSAPMDTVSLSPVLQLTNPVALFSFPFFQTNPAPPPQIPSFQPLTGTDPTLVSSFTLFQNYPNPFNPMTTIEFSLPSQKYVTMKVFNILGQEVATLLNNQLLSAGRQIVDFNADALTSGVYFYRLMAEDPVTRLNSSQMKKMILMK